MVLRLADGWIDDVGVAVFFSLPVAGLCWMAAIPRRLRRHRYRADVQPPLRDWGSYVWHPTATQVWSGGVRIGMINAISPRATLTADPQVALIRVPRFRPDRFRDVWIDRREVIGIRLIPGIMTSGVAFDAVDSSLDGVIFWTLSRHRVHTALVGLGWPDRPASRTA